MKPWDVQLERNIPTEPLFVRVSRGSWLDGDMTERERRLIAAAPELLEALILAKKWSIYNQVDTSLSVYDWADKARAAIMKVTGG